MKKNIASSLIASLFVLLAACYSSSGQSPPPAPSANPAPAPAEPSTAPSTPSTPPASAAGECVPSGCSGTLCVAAGKEVMSTCEYKAEYACYSKARCEKQGNGECGWTKNPEFEACIASGGPK